MARGRLNTPAPAPLNHKPPIMNFFAGMIVRVNVDLGHFAEQSAGHREGFVIYIGNEVQAVKWRDWKLHYAWQDDPDQPLEANAHAYKAIFPCKEQPLLQASSHRSWVPAASPGYGCNWAAAKRLAGRLRAEH
jgi:hypothetical protein